jgi:hypothetical protein
VTTTADCGKIGTHHSQVRKARITIMKITRRRVDALLLAVSGSFWMSLAFAQLDGAAKVAPMGEGRMEPRNQVGIMGPSPEFDAQAALMRKKLADPELRAQVRTEQSAQVDSLNPDLVQVLGLDTAQGSALLDLMTEQQMRHLDLFFVDRSAPRSAADINAQMQQLTTEDIRNKQQIRELIGESRFELYLDYTDTLRERQEAVYFDGRLDASNKLTADQKQRLMQIMRTQNQQSLQRRRATSGMMPSEQRSRSEDLRATMRRQRASLTENSFRQMQEDDRLLVARLPEVLTPGQIAVFKNMEDEKLAAQRKYVQQARLDAGMSPEFNEGPPAGPTEGRAPVTGPVRLEVNFRTNNNDPVASVLITENGQPAAPFEASDGLWVEATPILFADGSANVDYNFYEENDGKRRALRNSLQVALRPPSIPVPRGGTSATIIAGRQKAYSIQVETQVSAPQ